MKTTIFLTLSFLLVPILVYSNSFTLKYSYKCCALEVNCEVPYNNIPGSEYTDVLTSKFKHAQFTCIDEKAFYLEGAKSPLNVDREVIKEIMSLNTMKYYTFMDCKDAKRLRGKNLSYLERVYPNLDYTRVAPDEIIDAGPYDIAYKAIVVQSADVFLKKNCE